MTDTLSRLHELFAQRWSGRLTTDAIAKCDAEIALIQIKAQVQIAEALTAMAYPALIYNEPPSMHPLPTSGRWSAVSPAPSPVPQWMIQNTPEGIAKLQASQQSLQMQATDAGVIENMLRAGTLSQSALSANKGLQESAQHLRDAWEQKGAEIFNKAGGQ